MATTNVQQWNPTGVNQETDAQYAADSQRAGGATNPAIFDATLANKLFYQLSTYVDGLFSAFAAKGFTTSDSNLSTLTAQCANFLTTADVRPAVIITTYAPTLTLNAAAANGFYVTSMTGNLSIAAINGLTSGQLIVLYFQQDGAGNRTVAFPSNVVGGVQPDPTPNSVSIQVLAYDSTTGMLRAAGPRISNTGTFFPGNVGVPATLTTVGFTLNSPGSDGQVLTNVGGLFVPRTVARAQGAVVDYSTGGRAVNTLYQNTSGGVMFVSGSLITAGSSVGDIAVVVLPPSGPSVTVWKNQSTATVGGGDAGFCGMVPNNWRYELQIAGAVTASVSAWTETVVS